MTALTRRRALALTAAFAAMPTGARAETWRGRAFGAEVSLTLRGPRAEAAAALAEARGILRGVERLFSLYDPTSALSRLNRTGRLDEPEARFMALMRAADRAHRLTDGLFDPTVQPLWHAPAAARAAVGWDRVRRNAEAIVLAPGQALAFNGIAQGFATDLVTEALAARGAREVLVDLGEQRALGGPWRLGLHDPAAGYLGTRTLHGGAIATSSPGAMALPGGGAYILHPTARPLWSTVSVEAREATLADALSTAFTMMSRARIETAAREAGLGRVTLVDGAGDLVTV